jgi:hypothetical protein
LVSDYSEGLPTIDNREPTGEPTDGSEVAVAARVLPISVSTNDYTGHGRKGVSPNRAGWASGPWEGPPGDGRAFVNLFGVNAINRDLVSLEIDRYYADPIKESGLKSIIQMTAWLADQQKIRWDSFPLNPHTTLVFTYEHGEFQAHKPCAGDVVRKYIPTIISNTQDILRVAQTGA